MVEVSEKKATVPEPDPFGIAKMTVAQLKEELRHRDLQLTGLKAVLRFRLEEYLKAEFSSDDYAQDENETTPELEVNTDNNVELEEETI